MLQGAFSAIRDLPRLHEITSVLIRHGLGDIVQRIGVSGVLSYLVSRRLREMSIRIALGARTPQILLLVLRGSVGTTVGGVLAGLLAVMAAAPLVRPLLFEVSPTDASILVTVAILLPGVAAAAALAPASRASRVDPARTLRAE